MPDSQKNYDHHDRQTMIQTARDSIAHGLKYRKSMAVDIKVFSTPLQQHRATFVTLQYNSQLRGCIGMLEPVRPLIQDIAENAFAAAFKDPRFYPVSEVEQPLLDIHISILSPHEPIEFDSEQDLVSKIRPNIDGLVIEDLGNRGTFLPAVWESLPRPEQFIQQLKLKAGLPADYWSDTLKVWRYTAESIH